MAEQAFHNHITINLNVVVAQQLSFDAGTKRSQVIPSHAQVDD